VKCTQSAGLPPRLEFSVPTAQKAETFVLGTIPAPGERKQMGRPLEQPTLSQIGVCYAASSFPWRCLLLRGVAISVLVFLVLPVSSRELKAKLAAAFPRSLFVAAPLAATIHRIMPEQNQSQKWAVRQQCANGLDCLNSVLRLCRKRRTSF
jgi:hypothetical protein